MIDEWCPSPFLSHSVKIPNETPGLVLQGEVPQLSAQQVSQWRRITPRSQRAGRRQKLFTAIEPKRGTTEHEYQDGEQTGKKVQFLKSEL